MTPQSRVPSNSIDGDDGLVSVVIPTYYRNDTLPETIRSVVEQTYDRVEIIIVDDSGEGHATPVVDSFDSVDYLRFSENKGPNHAREAGIKTARGEYIHLLDDDDRMRPRKLEKQVAAFDSNSDAGVVYTGATVGENRTVYPDADGRGKVLEKALKFDLWPCMTSTMLIRRDVLSEIRPLSSRRAATDLELMIKLARLAAFDFVDEPLLDKRLDQKSLGHSRDAVVGRLSILNDYRNLYASFPDSVARTALANTYETKAGIQLKRNPWSVTAIGALVVSLLYRPDRNAGSIVKLVASLLGRPGWRLMRVIGGR